MQQSLLDGLIRPFALPCAWTSQGHPVARNRDSSTPQHHLVPRIAATPIVLCCPVTQCFSLSSTHLAPNFSGAG